jgi:ABC-2 type transport system ATP-binding protein
MVATANLPEPSTPAGADAPTNAVEIRDVSRTFGANRALDRVSLDIPVGTVLGLVGENGAGKTTLIRHVLGLLRAQSGSVRVFGRDPVRDPVGVLSRVGYLSEEPDMPGWMRVHQLLRYVSGFYPDWDADYAERLRRDFGLDPDGRVKDLSKGQRARAGLIAALAYRPQLLVLDEPSSGLDPVVRRDILGAIIRTIAEEGRTVLFSSHLLAEVERVSDRIAMIKDGRVLFCDTPERIHEVHARVTFRFEQPRATAPHLVEALAWEGSGREWTAIVAAAPEAMETALEPDGGEMVERTSVTLDEIFVARAGGKLFDAEAR